jgi:FAD/FMN-containing dehydrogenase
MSNSFVLAVQGLQPGLPMPLGTSHPWYLLIEASDTLADLDLADHLAHALAPLLETGAIIAATIAANAQQAADLWRLRHGASDIPRLGSAFGYDTSVPIDREADFVAAIERQVKHAYPEAEIYLFGHIGDGNIHCIVVFGNGAKTPKTGAFADIGAIVDTVVLSLGGSISAEHGIGYTNKERFTASASSVDLDLMRRLKNALDPNNLLNPGKVF